MGATRVIGIGGSSGAKKPLEQILACLPADFPHILLVALHRHETSDSFLSELLDRRCALAVRQAQDGEAVRAGTVYVAPPDRHLLFTDGHMRLTSGPRENRSRPAIDVTMRSIAVACGPRSAGILLSGLLNDGVNGLRCIAECGGTTVVQTPEDADYRDMPDHALAALTPDHTLPAGDIAGILLSLPAVGAGAAYEPPPRMKAEVDMALGRRLDIPTEEWLGERGNVTCPDCGGGLWRMHAEPPVRFRCHTGHAFTAEVLAQTQAEKVEEAMWVAMRVLRERAETLRGLARQASGESQRKSWEKRAREADGHADALAESLVPIATAGNA